MVQKQRTSLIIWKIALRLIVLFIIIFISSWENPIALHILKNYLGYVTPEGFFGFTFADDFVSFALMLVFVGGIFLCALGKITDYILLCLLIALAGWEYFNVITFTSMMGVGFVMAIIVGCLIGFSLKLLQQKFLPKLKL